MENITATEPKTGRTTPSGTGNKKTVKGTAPKTVREQNGKAETIKAESMSDKSPVKAESVKDTTPAKAEFVKDTTLVKEEIRKEAASANGKTNEEKNNEEKTIVLDEKKNPVKKTPKTKAVKKNPAEKKAAEKKAIGKKNNDAINFLYEEGNDPSIMLIVEENPNEMIFNAIEESEPDRDAGKKKVKKEKKNKKSDKQKTIKRRTLCKLVKNDFLKKHFSEYKDLVTDPAWICRKCGRVANDPKFLCKPILLNKIDGGDIIIS